MTEKTPLKPFVATLDPAMIDTLKNGLLERGFEFSTPPYTIFAAKKKNLAVTLYTSLKLTVMGKEMGEFIEYYLEPEILKSFSFTNPVASLELDLTGRIGVDEAGKGDFFGPLCIAAVYAQGEEIEKMVKLGIKDSKTLSDSTILKLAEQIRKNFLYEVIRIGPSKYNEMYGNFGNLNSLLAWGHATAIEKLSERSHCTNAIIDKFAHEFVVERALARKKLKINLTQRTKGEQDPVVAAASILARAAFVEGIKKLSEEAGFELPKGASQAVIAAGKKAVATFGRDVLPKISKTHFKTTEQI
ncbi:MAG: ribonuclease HIII [Verrucomicrobia bacterium]|nr:ribonuclease HIII [Verrucomicrobiota bacterium]MBS0637097.1 ribonuclease HIII [Verrucomicrobiota bacterium]